MANSETNKRPNRKRKKSFLKNARKYAKKGHYGRGAEIDVDTYQYFIRIMEVYREGFDSEEDKTSFVSNVFEQTEEKEVNCSCNQVGCRVIETLLPFASDQILERFIKAFETQLRPLCGDRFASHVLEALVKESTKRCINEKSEMKQAFLDFSVKVSKFLLNNLEDFVWDTYGNHIIRTCLISLGQIPDEKNLRQEKQKEKQEPDLIPKDIPEEFTEIVKDLGGRLLTWPQFSELCKNEITSGFLQVLIKVLKKVDYKLMKKYLKKLIDENFIEENKSDNPKVIPNVFLNKALMMLLETALEVANSKLFTQIYANCFLGKLVKLSVTRNTNFAVQKLLSNCSEKVEFEAMFDEVMEHFGEILEAGHSGVLLALCQGCKRLGSKQGSFVQNMMKALNCFEPEANQSQFVLCMSKLVKYDDLKTQNLDTLQKDKLNLHGTLMIQQILEFNKPIKIVNNILQMDPQVLKNLFSNSMGSHIVDSFVSSTFVGEKSREKLVRTLKGNYQELASSKYGSRAFEAIWKVANTKSRIAIMEELSYKDASWSNSEHGKIISAKVNLVLFKRNKDDWKNNLNKTNKVEEIFAEVLK